MKPIEMFDTLVGDQRYDGDVAALYKELREKIEAMTIIADTFIAGMVPYQLEGDDAIGPERMRQMKAAVIRYDPSIEPVMRRWEDGP